MNPRMRIINSRRGPHPAFINTVVGHFTRDDRTDSYRGSVSGIAEMAPGTAAPFTSPVRERKSAIKFMHQRVCVRNR